MINNLRKLRVFYLKTKLIFKVKIYNFFKISMPKLISILYNETQMNWKFYFFTRFFIKPTVENLWRQLKIEPQENMQIRLEKWYRKQHGGPQLHEKIRDELVKLGKECGVSRLVNH